MILLAPQPQKEWFANLLSLLVDITLKLPMPWNLLVLPHIQKFHRTLESQRLHAWKLSGDSSERQDFLRRFQTLPPQISGDLLHACMRESGPDSFNGVVEGILLQAGPLSCS